MRPRRTGPSTRARLRVLRGCARDHVPDNTLAAVSRPERYEPDVNPLHQDLCTKREISCRWEFTLRNRQSQSQRPADKEYKAADFAYDDHEQCASNQMEDRWRH